MYMLVPKRSPQHHFVEDMCSYDKFARYGPNVTSLIEKDIKCDSWSYDKEFFTLTMMSEVRLRKY